jgi:hypothetical protein
LPFFFSGLRYRTLRVKVCLPLWPSSLFAPSTHAAHNTTTAAISRFIFLNGWDLARTLPVSGLPGLSMLSSSGRGACHSMLANRLKHTPSTSCLPGRAGACKAQRHVALAIAAFALVLVVWRRASAELDFGSALRHKMAGLEREPSAAARRDGCKFVRSQHSSQAVSK